MQTSLDARDDGKKPPQDIFDCYLVNPEIAFTKIGKGLTKVAKETAHTTDRFVTESVRDFIFKEREKYAKKNYSVEMYDIFDITLDTLLDTHNYIIYLYSAQHCLKGKSSRRRKDPTSPGPTDDQSTHASADSAELHDAKLDSGLSKDSALDELLGDSGLRKVQDRTPGETLPSGGFHKLGTVKMTGSCREFIKGMTTITVPKKTLHVMNGLSIRKLISGNLS